MVRLWVQGSTLVAADAYGHPRQLASTLSVVARWTFLCLDWSWKIGWLNWNWVQGFLFEDSIFSIKDIDGSGLANKSRFRRVQYNVPARLSFALAGHLVHGCPSWFERPPKKRTVDHCTHVICPAYDVQVPTQMNMLDYAGVHNDVHIHTGTSICLSILHIQITQISEYIRIMHILEIYDTQLPHHGTDFFTFEHFGTDLPRSKWWMALGIGVIRTLLRRVVFVVEPTMRL